MGDLDSLFRVLFLVVLLPNLVVSAVHRRRAREHEVLARSSEPTGIKAVRALIALPGLVGMLAYLIHPAWMTWAQVPLPPAVRWTGVVLGLANVAFMHWVLRTLGSNVSETIFTKEGHELVTSGPYHWVRHPLYTGGFLLLAALSLISANVFFAGVLLLTMVIWNALIIPREEAHLAARFGRAYDEYRAATARMLPGL